MRKNVFIDRYKRLNVIKDRNNFLRKMEDLKPYMIKFKKDDKIKLNVYLFDCTVGSND